jgi:hypothetical protein
MQANTCMSSTACRKNRKRRPSPIVGLCLLRMAADGDKLLKAFGVTLGIRRSWKTSPQTTLCAAKNFVLGIREIFQGLEFRNSRRVRHWPFGGRWHSRWRILDFFIRLFPANFGRKVRPRGNNHASRVWNATWWSRVDYSLNDPDALHHGVILVGLPYSFQGTMDEISGCSPYGFSINGGAAAVPRHLRQRLPEGCVQKLNNSIIHSFSPRASRGFRWKTSLDRMANCALSNFSSRAESQIIFSVCRRSARRGGLKSARLQVRSPKAGGRHQV